LGRVEDGRGRYRRRTTKSTFKKVEPKAIDRTLNESNWQLFLYFSVSHFLFLFSLSISFFLFHFSFILLSDKDGQRHDISVKGAIRHTTRRIVRAPYQAKTQKDKKDKLSTGAIKLHGPYPRGHPKHHKHRPKIPRRKH